MLAILRQPIAKQAMPFGDQNSLNSCLRFWLCRIAQSSLAILQQPIIAKQAMPFGYQNLLNNRLRFWLCRIAQSSLAILQQPIIAKQAMPFGDHLSLKSKGDLDMFYRLIYAGDMAMNNC